MVWFLQAKLLKKGGQSYVFVLLATRIWNHHGNSSCGGSAGFHP